MNSLINKLKNTNENNKIILKNTIQAFIIKGGALIISLFTMPAYMRYFENQEVLGLWFTVLSVLSWILTFDFGIGNGLRNKLVEAIAKNNKEDIRSYISSAYYIVGLITLVGLIIGYNISVFVDWNSVFNISETLISKHVMLNVTRCIFIGIMIQFLLRLISSVLYALQKSAINNFLSLITSILQFGFVILAPSFNPEINLKMLSYFYILCTNIPLFIITVLVFATKLKDSFPKINYFSKKHAGEVLKTGGMFFWCQIMYMVIVNTNEFFISNYTSPACVVEYQVYNKLFSLVGMLFTLALTPIWSAVTKSIAEGDFNWLKKLFDTLKKIALLAIVGEFFIIAFLQIIVNLWLSEKALHINYIYAICFAIFGGSFIYQTILSTIVCGMGKMKLQSICYTIGVFFKFIIIHFGMILFDSWIIVVVANAAILIPYCILQQISLNRYIKLNLMKRGNINV